FASCLRDNSAYIVENPREAEVCSDCSVKDTCMECAEMVAPITTGNTAEGAIGLIAFDKQQKKKLLKNEAGILSFLQKMSQMIAATLTEKEKTAQINILAGQLQTVMDIMDKGIITVDSIGDIKYKNSIADSMLGITQQRFRNVQEIINHTSIKDFRLGKKLKSREFEYRHPSGKVTGGIISTKIIESEEGTQSSVFIIQEMQGLIKSARSLISANIATPFDNIIHKSLIMEDTIKLAKKASQSNSTLLITGESGTGKELFARAVHYASDRKSEPFIAINCSAIPENLFESELFGYSEGAFTGASRGGHPGKFELADRGTLLLDEIGEMPLHLQPKLLRVLQDGRVTRVGGSRQIEVDVRIIASTNVNLEEKVRNREFREDLYYRLNVIPLDVPPLRARREDIGIMTSTFIEKFSHKLGKKVEGAEISVLRVIEAYEWEGNVRELENAVEYAVNMSEGSIISLRDLPPKLQITASDRNDQQGIEKVAAEQSEKQRTNIMNLEELEKREIEKAMIYRENHGLTMDEMCNMLGISRATLYRKIKKT
ncbi:MAG: sigma 54-interacting transcriptional regulator, partial [Proteocatella sp.]|nr:sigma 54-interacting transcriptional regulator [Proteocatella sp.]